VHVALDGGSSTGATVVGRLLVAIIAAASVTAILETEPTLTEGRETLFAAFEHGFGIIFATEYLARAWSAADGSSGREALQLRTRFIASPSGKIDLAVLVSTFLPLVAFNLAPLRVVRIARLLRLAKLGRTSAAMRHLREAFTSQRHELLLALTLAGMVLVAAATAMYAAEADAQPEKFGSIPRAMWWAVVTMTTIGYGDVYPVTVAGRVVATATAIVSIGLIAMPTGILAAAFADVMRRERDKERDRPEGEAN